MASYVEWLNFVHKRSTAPNKKAPDINFPDIEVYKDGEPNNSMMVACSVLQEKSIRVADVYKEESFNFSGTRTFDEKTGYHTHSVLTVPCTGQVQPDTFFREFS